VARDLIGCKRRERPRAVGFGFKLFGKHGERGLAQKLDGGLDQEPGSIAFGTIKQRQALGRGEAAGAPREIAGGILGALLLWAMFSTTPLYNRKTTGLGADGWGAASHIHIGGGGAFLAEAMLTALFVFVILGVTSKGANAATAGMVIGLTLTVVHLIGIPITGTSVNPARSLGPALVVGGTALRQVWLFIVAPVVGGAVAAALHRILFRAKNLESA